MNPAWFDSSVDWGIAFLLPLLTALSGMWLLRFLVPSLVARMPLLEQLACALGLGMMAAAALTLGIKLCGWSGREVIFVSALTGSVAEIWRRYRLYTNELNSFYQHTIGSLTRIILVVAGIIVFLILFRLAGVQGLMDGDAPRWMLKANILHLYTGKAIVHWFSNPAFAHAHLDYPTLVPSLHAATYDSIGHIDEFVTKFWPVWMLLFLIAALATSNRVLKGRLFVPHWALFGLLLLPAIQDYAQWEGSSMPMVFFTVLGLLQCSLGLLAKDGTRLVLGLTLLFGAAMTTYQGFIFLALAALFILPLPAAWTACRTTKVWWRMAVFCVLAALPFFACVSRYRS